MGWYVCNNCNIFNNDRNTIASDEFNRFTNDVTYNPELVKARQNSSDLVIMSYEEEEEDEEDEGEDEEEDDEVVMVVVMIMIVIYRSES